MNSLTIAVKSISIFGVVLVASFLFFIVLGAVTGGSSGAGVGVLFAILLIPYLFPAIIAYSRRHPSCHAILALNVLLGWTLIGWVVSIVWALKNHRTNIQVVIANTGQVGTNTADIETREVSKYD